VLAAGRELALTSTEFGILEILMRRAPNVVDRRSIARHVWDEAAGALGSNTIEVVHAPWRACALGCLRVEVEP
jgi:DNA-binding response OmpR family regulator